MNRRAKRFIAAYDKIAEIREQADRDLLWYRGVGRPRTTALAVYNSEVSRGIVHTPEWDALMAEEQAVFNESMQREGHT